MPAVATWRPESLKKEGSTEKDMAEAIEKGNHSDVQ
jgi:hypothetical protein